MASQPLSGGVAAHVVELVEALPRDRFEVEVACPRRSEVWTRLEGRDDVRLHAVGEHRRPAPGDVRSLATLLPLIRRADVVHAHSSKAGFLARFAAALAGRRRSCVFTPHAWSFWAVDGAEGALYERLERLAAHWCGAIVTLSEDERAAGLARGVGSPPLYRVIPNGIDLARYAAEPEPVPGRLLFVGRFAQQKRPDLAIRAFALVAAEFPESELRFVGDGEGQAEAERLAGELGLEGRVRFLGPRGDVPQLLSQGAALVLASRYEGCPLVVLEAMAAGLPVVATEVGGLGELVDDGRTGLLTGPEDVEGLAAAFRRLLADPEAARAMGLAAREHARERFSRETMVGRLAALYEEVAPPKRG